MLISFIVTTWLLAMLPGVGQALMLRQTLMHGCAAAWATIAGTATGLVLWATAAAAGLSALILADPRLYRGLLLAGGCLLAVIGLRALWSARVRQSGEITTPRAGRGSGYLTGLATNLANPKAGVFAVSLLPGFVNGSEDIFWPTLLLGVLWAVVTATWYVVFVALVARGRRFATRPAVQRWLSIASGTALIILGVTVALGA